MSSRSRLSRDRRSSQEHAVELVDLVLEAGGEEAGRLGLVDGAVEALVAQAEAGRTLDLLVEARQRHAASRWRAVSGDVQTISGLT